MRPIQRSGEYLKIDGKWYRVPREAEAAIRKEEQLKREVDSKET